MHIKSAATRDYDKTKLSYHCILFKICTVTWGQYHNESHNYFITFFTSKNLGQL
jgi:hypothetical protein